MVWSKPAPSKDWPMRETLYEWSGSATKIGRLVIRKSTYEKVDRGRELFTARAFLRIHDAGPGLIRIGDSESVMAPWIVESGGPRISVKVEFSTKGYWRWVIEQGLDIQRARRFPTAWWVV